MADNLVKKLNIGSAIEKEAASSRNLVPPEPGWSRIVANSRSVEKWIGSVLRSGSSSGFVPSGQQMTSARKAYGVRPIPYWGPVERVTYRALTDYILPNFLLDRSTEAYLAFVRAPVWHSRELQRKSTTTSLDVSQNPFFFFFGRSEIEYVVKSDITAFYQYVDHSILGQELLVRGGDYDAIDHLLELLCEVQGRSYGIPQLLDPSDYLSEIYIDRVERQLIRKGLHIWRFNDDFRVACRTYAEALNSIEQIDAAAREVGLVINESKTLTYGFRNYMFDNIGLELQPVENKVLLDDVEAVVGDYTDDFSQEPEAAKNVINSAQASPIAGVNHAIDLRSTGANDIRVLRRAFNALAAASDPGATGNVLRLLIYVPALCPTLIRYLISVNGIAADQVADVVDTIIDKVSMNEWQRQWIIYCIHELKLLQDGTHGCLIIRIEWVEKARLTSPSAVTVALATFALAAAQTIEFDQVMQEYESSPASLLVWYTTALSEYHDDGHAGDLKKRINAVASISPLHQALVSDVST